LITKIVYFLKKLESSDNLRVEITDRILSTLESLGVIPFKKSINQLERLSTASFLRRRLIVIIVQLHFAKTLKDANNLVTQGHIRVGPTIVTDPDTLVTKNMQNFISWAHEP
jgi:U3 small nucleolar ribonucleoprotein protein IMP3